MRDAQQSVRRDCNFVFGLRAWEGNDGDAAEERDFLQVCSVLSTKVGVEFAGDSNWSIEKASVIQGRSISFEAFRLTIFTNEGEDPDRLIPLERCWRTESLS